MSWEGGVVFAESGPTGGSASPLPRAKRSRKPRIYAKVFRVTMCRAPERAGLLGTGIYTPTQETVKPRDPPQLSIHLRGDSDLADHVIASPAEKPGKQSP